MLYCMLSEMGFGSIKELQELDTPDFLDLVEYMQIKRAIEAHAMRDR